MKRPRIFNHRILKVSLYKKRKKISGKKFLILIKKSKNFINNNNNKLPKKTPNKKAQLRRHKIIKLMKKSLKHKKNLEAKAIKEIKMTMYSII